jgi:hypothetical protein
MDSEDEMMITLLMQEEAEATVESKKGLLLLISLLGQWAKLQPPHIGGSVRQAEEHCAHRLAGAEMLEDDYFKDGVGPKYFVAVFG